jgi:hypothetical protein
VTGRIAQCHPDACNGYVQAIVEVNENVIAPNTPSQLIAGDDLPGVLEQSGEHLKGLFAEPNPPASLAKMSCGKIDFEAIEPAQFFHYYPTPVTRPRRASIALMTLIVSYQQDAQKENLQGECSRRLLDFAADGTIMSCKTLSGA